MIAKVSVGIDIAVEGHGFDAKFGRDCGNGRISVCHGGLRKPDLCLGQGELSPAVALTLTGVILNLCGGAEAFEP